MRALPTGLLLVAIALTSVINVVGVAADTSPDETTTRIAKLIDELGHEEFTIRERAQAELQSLGLAAFDALNDAVEHDDIEIVLRARYLLRSMRVQWYSEDDPPKLKQLLTDYGNQSEKDRRSRIDSLSKSDSGDVLRALCRLARFETDARLSKLAALRAMQRPVANQRAEGATIARHISNSARPGAEWLRLYAAQLGGDDDVLSQWNDVIRSERRTLVSAAARTSLELVRDLSRWHVDQLQTANQPEQAVAAIRRSLELIDGSKEQVKENALWLMKEKAWKLVRELAERHPVYFDSSVDFKYLLAEAELGSGSKAEAQAAAQAALELKPDAHEEHIEAAVHLTDRGLHDWAAAEFEERIKLNAEGSTFNLRARFLYSEMLHDGMLQHLKAGDLLEKAVEAMKDPAVQQQVRLSLGRNPAYVSSRMHYFKALGLTKKGDLDDAVKHLNDANMLYSEDPDVLIAMYRMPNQADTYKESVKTKISASAKRLKAEVTQYRSLVSRRAFGPVRQQYESRLASYCNQYAWLVANTIGDYKDALACSKQSLELTPNSPVYLDTLARCYYATGDYENAVKHQRIAVEQTPHSGLMQKQLSLFEEALAKQSGQ